MHLLGKAIILLIVLATVFLFATSESAAQSKTLGDLFRQRERNQMASQSERFNEQLRKSKTIGELELSRAYLKIRPINQTPPDQFLHCLAALDPDLKNQVGNPPYSNREKERIENSARRWPTSGTFKLTTSVRFIEQRDNSGRQYLVLAHNSEINFSGHATKKIQYALAEGGDMCTFDKKGMGILTIILSSGFVNKVWEIEPQDLQNSQVHLKLERQNMNGRSFRFIDLPIEWIFRIDKVRRPSNSSNSAFKKYVYLPAIEITAKVVQAQLLDSSTGRRTIKIFE